MCRINGGGHTSSPVIIEKKKEKEKKRKKHALWAYEYNNFSALLWAGLLSLPINTCPCVTDFILSAMQRTNSSPFPWSMDSAYEDETRRRFLYSTRAVVRGLKAQVPAFVARPVPQGVLIDLATLRPPSFSRYKPKVAKVSAEYAQGTLENNVSPGTAVIMMRGFCAICLEYKKEGVKLFRTCKVLEPVQHLVCENCVEKLDEHNSDKCPLCREPRLGQRAEQCEELRGSFHHRVCQSCPLCTDPTGRTAEALLSHVHSECAAVEPETVVVDLKKLREEFARQRSQCISDFCDSDVMFSNVQRGMCECTRSVLEHKRILHETLTHCMEELKQLRMLEQHQESTKEYLRWDNLQLRGDYKALYDAHNNLLRQFTGRGEAQGDRVRHPLSRSAAEVQQQVAEPEQCRSARSCTDHPERPKRRRRTRARSDSVFM